MLLAMACVLVCFDPVICISGRVRAVISQGRKGRLESISVHVGIAAAPSLVWKALTDPVELVRWFSVEARVSPGPNGLILASWSESIGAKFRVEVWEPKVHLRLIEIAPLGAILKASANLGTCTAEFGREPRDRPRRLIDYFLEPRTGGTLLRVVHTGFDTSSDWEDRVRESVRRGWEFELRSLRHYLERHSGEQRSVVPLRRLYRFSSEETWDRLMGPQGLIDTRPFNGMLEGDQFSILTAAGDRLNGAVLIYDPPNQFAVTLANLKDSLFRIKVDATMTGVVETSLWLATYGLTKPVLKSFERRWRNLIDNRFR